MEPTVVDVVYVWCGKPENRYCSFNKDLEYSVLSVRKFMPWVRYIWVVVEDAYVAQNFQVLPRKVKIVRESEFIPRKYLPITWNSNVVESWIWRIKELSEHFIYMCDDMYIGKPTGVGAFFGPGGEPILRVYEGAPDYPGLSQVRSTIPYVRMWANAVEKYGMHYTRIQHQVLPYRKSLMHKFYLKYKKEVDRASGNKIRAGEGDFNLLRFTSALAVMSGDSLLKVTGDSYDYFVESLDVPRIRAILKVRPQFFCINNNVMENEYVYKMLDAYYARPAAKQ